jgi:hypothetical protein
MRPRAISFHGGAFEQTAARKSGTDDVVNQVVGRSKFGRWAAVAPRQTAAAAV